LGQAQVAVDVAEQGGGRGIFRRRIANRRYPRKPPATPTQVVCMPFDFCYAIFSASMSSVTVTLTSNSKTGRRFLEPS
jgi:hypothetical protein